MNNMQIKNELPYLIGADDAMTFFGFSRPMVYNLLNDPECGVCVIGKRKFFIRDRFLEWIEKNTLKQEKKP